MAGEQRLFLILSELEQQCEILQKIGENYGNSKKMHLNKKFLFISNTQYSFSCFFDTRTKINLKQLKKRKQNENILNTPSKSVLKETEEALNVEKRLK